MKRSGPPRRRKALRRGGALAPQSKRAVGRIPDKGRADRRPAKTAPHRWDADWQEARMACMFRAGGACQAARPGCNGRGGQAHHLLPRSAGGTNDQANLAWLCEPCHSWVHAHPHTAYRLGLLRHRGWQPPVPDADGRLHYPDAIDVHGIGHDVWLPEHLTPAWRTLP